MPLGTLGHEWNEDVDNGFRPAGLMHLSTATLAVDSKIQDHGSTFGPGTATHHLTMYRAASGALVFSAGTVQWGWGLDGTHDVFYTATLRPPDARMQQATVNLFADMGAQPATLQAGLVAATASGDAVAPGSTITSPTGGGTVQGGTTVTVTGTAADTGGGNVAAVEVSVDGGTTWHPAVGRNTWSYTWAVSGAGPVTLKSRAVDDSANLESPGAGVNVTVLCPCQLWANATPGVASSGDTQAVEVGVKFSSDLDGWITAIRFYKGAGQHRDARRQPLDRRRHAALARDVHLRDRDRLAAGGARHPGVRHRRARPTSPRTTPPLGDTRSTSSTSRSSTTTRRCTRRLAATASSATARRQSSPTTATAPATTGSTSSSPTRRRRTSRRLSSPRYLRRARPASTRLRP